MAKVEDRTAADSEVARRLTALPDEVEVAEQEPARRRFSKGLLLDRYSGVLVLIGLIVLFSVLRPHTFFTVRNLRTVVAEQAVTAIASIGLLIAFACGAFDLSVGAALGLAVVVVTWLQAHFGIPPVLAILATIGVGVAVGTVNGFLVTKLRVNSFIATLAMASILQAVIYGVSDGNNIIGGNSGGFLRFGQAQPGGVPVIIFYMLVIAAVVWFVLEHTPVGRFLYAVGSNPEAARLSGIRTSRYLFGSLVASAALASVAGVIFAAKVGSASLTAGPPYLLPAFAAVLLGTTQIRPGRPNVAGTVLAIFWSRSAARAST